MPIDTSGKSKASDIEFSGVKNVIEFFETGSRAALNRLNIEQAAAEKRLRAAEEKAKEDLYKRIADLQFKSIIKTNEEAVKYASSELHKQQRDKLQSEIEILRVISAEKEAERKKELIRLEKEKEIITLRNAGNEEEARKKEKELAQQRKRDQREQEKKTRQEEGDAYEFGDIFYDSLKDLRDEIADGNALAKTSEKNLVNTLKGVGRAIQDGLNAINNAISTYAKYQTAINARLQGSNAKNYDTVVKNLSSIAFSPLLRAEDLYSNLSDIVAQGIATNVEQRAMFATVKDGIATTFDVTSDTLKRMIRVQQNDSTAARLGMEAYLTKFLNTYVENTEYLQNTFDSVASSLFEASAMLGQASGTNATAEFEYIVQKWLGTLSGVGLSDSTAQEIATALGQLGSGDVESLSNSNMQNLLVMAANKANLSYAEMLTNGLDAVDTNNLMKGLVEYLQEIANTGTNVVKNQLSKVFGVTVSDLVAVSNLNSSAIATVHKDMLSYKNMYGELEAQFKELPSRLGISNILENLFSNMTYQTGMSIGSNPVTYALWKITDMIQSVTGGINIPFISTFGNAFGLNATVENLMKLGIVGVSTLGNIGKIAGGLGSVGNGAVLLKKLGVNEAGAEVKTFGGSVLTNGKRTSGQSISESSYIGNSDSDTYYDSTINSANDESQAKLDAKLKEYNDPVVQYLDETLKIQSVYEEFDSKLQAIIQNQLIAAEAASEASNKLFADLSQEATLGDTQKNATNTDQLANTTTNNLLIALINAAISQSQNINKKIAETVAPVASNLTTIDMSAAAILTQVTALNGNILTGISEITTALDEILAKEANDVSSAYNNFQNENNPITNYENAIINAVNKTQDSINNNLNNVTNNLQLQDVSSIVPNASKTSSATETIIDNSVIQNIENTTINPVDVGTQSNNINNVRDGEYTKYIENIGAQQVDKAQVNDGKVYDISNYLVEIDFAMGFKSLVDNVAKILERLSNDVGADILDNDITGFTQFSF